MFLFFCYWMTYLISPIFSVFPSYPSLFYPHKVIQFHSLHHKFNFVCFFVFFVVSCIVISFRFNLLAMFIYLSYPSKHCFFISLAFFMTLFLFCLTRSCSLLLFLSFDPFCNALYPYSILASIAFLSLWFFCSNTGRFSLVFFSPEV